MYKLKKDFANSFKIPCIKKGYDKKYLKYFDCIITSGFRIY